MFYDVSKLFWAIAAPSNVIGLLLLIGLIGALLRWRRVSRMALATGAAAYVLLGVLPVGLALLKPLEDRFPRPSPDLPAPYGIIVLGGGIDQLISAGRDLAQLTDAGNRMPQAVMLARRYPQAKFVFSGGSPFVTPQIHTEAEAAKRYFTEQGLPEDRLILEDRSRNTWENAVFTRDIVHPQPGQRWLLVTSASHMPRSVGIFRRVGFDVVAYPADYETQPRPQWRPSAEAGFGLHLTDRAVREYIGLAAYRLTGKTDALFPAP